MKFTADLTAGEAQILLQFGLNLAITAGLVKFMKADEDKHQMEFDFPEDATMQ